MNQVRARVYEQGLEKGYSYISYVSSHATVLTDKIGENCFILEDNTIQPYVTIGNNCVLWSGNHIGHHGIIGDHIFLPRMSCFLGAVKWGIIAFWRQRYDSRQISFRRGDFNCHGSKFNSSKTEPWSIWKGNPAEKSSLSSKDIKI